jgi:hypothetical protein
MRNQSRLITLFFAAFVVIGISTVTVIKASGTSEPPVVTAVTPAPVVASSTPQLLQVTGTGFAPGLVVELTVQGQTETFSGAAVQNAKATTFEISVVLAQAGAASLVVRNTDGGVSAPFALTVTSGPAQKPAPAPAPQPTPVIDRADPEKATRSTVAQPVNLSGKSFVQGLVVTVTDPTGTVTTIDTNAIEAVSPTAVRFRVVLNVSGEYTFTVTNPKGQPSNAVTVAVT